MIHHNERTTMKKTPTKKLNLSRERLMRLDGAQLAQVAGGTQLVTVDDPITRRSQIATCDSCIKG